MNERLWNSLLLATLVRCRDFLPGPGIDEKGLERLSPIERCKAELRIDINELLAMARERGSFSG